MREQTDKTAQTILAYLRRKPDAGDTLEGIARWWLEIERIESSVSEVVRALDELTGRGVIRMRPLKDGTAFYTANGQDSPPVCVKSCRNTNRLP